MKIASQWEQVKDTMKRNGGFATLGFLYNNVDVSNWATKTPFASIRRIVQTNEFFFKIKPGLWGLSEQKAAIIEKFGINERKSDKYNLFNHSYYQGLVVEIGNIKGYSTFVPNQDKNKQFLNQTLKEVATLKEIYKFTYPEIVRRANTVDIIWFNQRKLPSSFFEIEHSTDIYNSLIKFSELQDFNSNFSIVCNIARKKEFDSKIKSSVFIDMHERIKFISYDQVSELHSNIFKYINLDKQLNM